MASLTTTLKLFHIPIFIFFTPLLLPSNVLLSYVSLCYAFPSLPLSILFFFHPHSQNFISLTSSFFFPTLKYSVIMPHSLTPSIIPSLSSSIPFSLSNAYIPHAFNFFFHYSTSPQILVYLIILMPYSHSFSQSFLHFVSSSLSHFQTVLSLPLSSFSVSLLSSNIHLFYATLSLITHSLSLFSIRSFPTPTFQLFLHPGVYLLFHTLFLRFCHMSYCHSFIQSFPHFLSSPLSHS